MTALLDLEPRVAGDRTVELAVEFDDGFYAEQDRTRCAGCCVQASAIEIATHSQTQ